MRKSILYLLLFITSFATFPARTAGQNTKKVIPLEAVRGNWFDTDCGGWTLGVYDSVVIADNTLYRLQSVQQRKRHIELTLQNKRNGTAQTLTLAPQRDGTCQWTLGKERRVLTRKPSQPVVVPDNGYDAFFRTDTATLQGYIDGYRRDLGFDTGLIYVENLALDTDQPTVVPIASDGTFTCKLPLHHPMSLYLQLNNEWLPFFIEPGQTQTLHVAWADILAAVQTDSDIPLLYMGGSAHLSALAKELDKKLTFAPGRISETQLTLTPAQFKESLAPYAAQWQHTGDSLATIYSASQKAVTLIRHSVALQEGNILFDFESSRIWKRRQYPDNEILKVSPDEAYYDFLHHMPLGAPEALACRNAGRFISGFGFMEILWKVNEGMKVDSSWTQKEVDERWCAHRIAQQAKTDSLAERVCGRTNPFLWRTAMLQQAQYNLETSKSYATKRMYAEALSKYTQGYPYLRTQLEQLYTDLQEKARSGSYALPEGPATDIFRNIIKEHAGKVLFIDFWATTCAPCRTGIEATAELRRKYKGHPDFQFIYITGAMDSPRAAYDRYVEEHLKGEASYYLNGTDFAYLRQLFHFKGIPHYELVEKDGKISTEHIEAHTLEMYLNERFPLNGENDAKK